MNLYIKILAIVLVLHSVTEFFNLDLKAEALYYEINHYMDTGEWINVETMQVWYFR